MTPASTSWAWYISRTDGCSPMTRVHRRLRVARLVALVVAVAPVADEVDDDIVAEAIAVHHRQPRGGQACLRVVGVDVDDRRVEALGQVGAVIGRASLAWPGREADLVVGDEVHRAAGGVAIETGKVERFGHHALRRERGVAVDQDRQRQCMVEPGDRSGSIGLLGAGATLDDRVDRLEVARVRRQDDLHLRVVGGQEGSLGAEVVLHVVRATLRRCRGLDPGAAGLELGQDRLVADADDVGLHVQPAAVRHADHHVARAVVGGVAQDDVEHRHHGVQPLDAEALLPEVRLVEEALQALDRDEPLEERDAVLVLHRLHGARRTR